MALGSDAQERPAVAQASQKRPMVVHASNDAAEARIAIAREASVAPALLSRLHREAEQLANKFVEDAAAEQRELRRTDPAIEPPTFSLTVEHRPRFVSRDLVSLLVVSEIFTGGAHGNLVFEGITYDIRRKRFVATQDILSGGGGWKENEARLKVIARNKLRAKKRERLGGDYDAARDDIWLEDLALPVEAMTLLPSTERGKAGGIEFHFAPYLAGPYAEGPYRIEISSRELEPMLAREWRDVFASEPIVLSHVSSAEGSKAAFVLIAAPQPDSVVRPPVELSGEAPDYFFEGDAIRAVISQLNGQVLSEGRLQADRQRRPSGMALDMVPFSGRLAVPHGEGPVLIKLGNGDSVAFSVTISRK
ncbi:DUF3298 and DUF4163 domain-containing protein [Rhodoligotrophos ferricapiens]|uniref:DUF3298 and DUF4163 domain-containing protein n=1 Tax=Rhodoligotrophos ferricapiens TaxID=3069264 RepID=UPI00315D3624